MRVRAHTREGDQNSIKFCYILHMDIQKLKKDQVQFLSLTSLYESEFDELLVPFHSKMDCFLQAQKNNGEAKNKTLKRMAIRKLHQSTSQS